MFPGRRRSLDVDLADEFNRHDATGAEHQLQFVTTQFRPYSRNHLTKCLTSFATCGSDKHASVTSFIFITSEGVSATLAPASWNLWHLMAMRFHTTEWPELSRWQDAPLLLGGSAGVKRAHCDVPTRRYLRSSVDTSPELFSFHLRFGDGELVMSSMAAIAALVLLLMARDLGVEAT